MTMNENTGPDTSVGGPHPATGVRERVASTGIYRVRGVSRDLQRAARARAVREGVTLRSVLVHAFRDYAAATWTPRPDETPSASAGARAEGQ
jgi:hypothetical protein